MKLDFIQKAFHNCKTEISQDGETITIFNPYLNENIVVDYEFYTSTDGSDSFEQYTTQFSYQHRHFSAEDEVIKWIQGVIGGTILAIELFEGKKNRGGGEIPFFGIEQLNDDIYNYILRFPKCDNFKIRSWNHENDYDGCILHHKENGVYIVINKI